MITPGTRAHYRGRLVNIVGIYPNGRRTIDSYGETRPSDRYHLRDDDTGEELFVNDPPAAELVPIPKAAAS